VGKAGGIMAVGGIGRARFLQNALYSKNFADESLQKEDSTVTKIPSNLARVSVQNANKEIPIK
jgi:hypothetical protein